MPYLKKSTPEKEPVDCRILTAALDLFVERGFHNVSVHDVQKSANVSIGSIYNHFGGKEGIAKALYYHLMKEFEEMIDEVISEDLTSRERCNKIIALLFEYTETRRNIISYMLHAKHREFLPDEPPICSSSPFKAMRNIVQQGIQAGEIRQGEPWIAAATVFGGAIRMIHLRLDGVIKEPLTNYYDELIDCIWSGMNPETLPEYSTQRSVV
ncbi:MAG: TetR/AcrR family transcriptional regulator [Candidatus Thiodiazotropha sp. (ex Myrtea spinifera)]|nr:TetR/AcrR family transcriptional regulator [Candidatus Thiodiazotropha sp. (ex Myrtea spinifera)]MCU7829914.1 TetR/AcrR family transcriptional regulator [Candidatus Thiodiazotropha sp. (ex Myrtea sp. 'scaly one' KF741663)]